MIQDYLSYDPISGLILWEKSPTNSTKANTEAGTIDCGRKRIKFKGRRYPYSSVAWFLFYGEWPKNIIDHIDGDSLNNKIENLRDVSTRENQSNMAVHRKGHLVGSTFNRHRNKWHSRIWHNGKSVHLGFYSTDKEAHEMYLKYKKAHNL